MGENGDPPKPDLYLPSDSEKSHNTRGDLSKVAVAYFPTVPDVWATARYQHVMALAQAVEDFTLITHNTPSNRLQTLATRTERIGGSVKEKVQSACQIARERLGDGDPFVTTFHYEPALAGFCASTLSKITWVVDIYDAPAQYRFNAPRSHHEISSRILESVLQRADLGIHSSSPDTPFRYGFREDFISNGSSVERTNPSLPSLDPLKLVWIGSPQLDRGGMILLKSLVQTDADVHVNVVGDNYEKTASQATELGADSLLTFHGRLNHSDALEIARNAHVGFAVLPSRPDWRFATPIKVGDYLATGTIPMMSDFPGMRYMVGECGRYLKPDVSAVATALEEMASLSQSEFETEYRHVVDRARQIDWSRIRTQIATKFLTASRRRDNSGALIVRDYLSDQTN